MTPSATETSGIRIQQLHKSYGSLEVLSGLNLTLARDTSTASWARTAPAKRP